MKKSIFIVSVLLLNFVTTEAIEITGYQLDITVTTTSDWCNLAPPENIPLSILDHEFVENNSPNAQVWMFQIVQSGNTFLIKVKFKTFLLNEGLNSDLTFVSTKGDWGDVTIKIEGMKNGSLTTVREFENHGYISGDPTNRREFSVPINDILDLDLKSYQLEEQNIEPTVFTFYYPWYGSPTGPNGAWFHWDPNNHYASTHEPLLGYYDSGSLETQQQHFAWARDYGVDVLISSWWGIGSYEDKRLVELLSEALNYPVKLSVYFETNGEIENASETLRPLVIKKHLRYILNNYGDHPSFFKFEDKPVIFLYGLPLTRIPADKWQQVVTDLRNEGFEFFISVDSFGADYVKIFDGFHTYNPLYHTQDQLRSIFKANLITSFYHQKIYAATILPGYDDTVIRTPGIQVSRENGAFYEGQWQVLAETKPAWVLITSWNEWHEGSDIEPSVEYGTQYLELTKQGRSLWDSTNVKAVETEKGLPNDFRFISVYPNPFNSSVQFKFYLPHSDHVQLEIFGILGRKINSLLDDNLSAGEYKIQWDGRSTNKKDISSGVYFFCLKSSSNIKVSKVICLR
ncbi:glycoside hydrolase family 99-like domain-containing protein [candidate division KSB1 bacterium]|nr:glycoside hydrolase family 99-like domain-containing protein [candidate division KSB1 bacterium]